MEDKKDNREKPTTTNNFYAPVGQVINNVEMQHVHFDKDMQMQVQNVEEQHIEAAPKPDFETVIPEYFRNKKMLPYWDKLRDAGLLDGEYRLITSKAAAHYMVQCFCAKRDEGKRETGKKEWAPFEKFWEIQHLKEADNTFANEVWEKINDIFGI